MKKQVKFLGFVVAFVSIAAIANAQPRAIGGNIGYGFDISYQHSLGEKNMIDLSVSIPAFHGVGAAATYDWINPFNTAVPWDKKGEWNWYMGVGAGAGAYYLFNPYLKPAWYVGAVGHIGIEYQFWFPMSLSLDWRPNFGVYGWGSDVYFNTHGLYTGITLGIRYLFNQ